MLSGHQRTADTSGHFLAGTYFSSIFKKPFTTTITTWFIILYRLPYFLIFYLRQVEVVVVEVGTVLEDLMTNFGHFLRNCRIIKM